jgi:hypothetical protein
LAIRLASPSATPAGAHSVRCLPGMDGSGPIQRACVRASATDSRAGSIPVQGVSRARMLRSKSCISRGTRSAAANMKPARERFTARYSPAHGYMPPSHRWCSSRISSAVKRCRLS